MMFGPALPSCLRSLLGLVRLAGLLGLAAILFVFSAPAALQQATNHRDSTQSPKLPSPFLNAEELFQQGSVAEARRQTEEQLQRNPASVEGYNLLGIICVAEKDYPSALQAFQHALEIDPKSTKTRNNLGNLYVAEEQFALADKEFREVLRVDPTNRDANYNLGLVLLAENKPADAIVHFQRVHPATIATGSNLVRAYLQAGRTAEGLKLANELSSENEENVQTHFTLGVVLLSAKQFRTAQQELEKANALRPETLEILHNLGQAYLGAADYSKAELVLNRALKLNPDSPETLYALARAYSLENRPVDALDLLVRAHKLAPQNTDVILLLARVSMSQNYFEDAIPLLESGLKIAPERGDLLAALGESYFMAGKTETAIEQFKKLVAQNPSAGSYAFLGLSYRHLGRFDEARKYFEEGLKKDPHNASCLFNLGFIEERQGNNIKAEQLFQQALHSNPNYFEALLELANLRIADKRFQEAVELLRRYVKASPQPGPGYYKLAMAERSLHQLDAAQRDLNVFQTLSKNPSTGPYPYQNLFDYLDNRASLTPQGRAEQDLNLLIEQIQKHPDQPQDLYLLAETYLKLGKRDEALQAIVQLDQMSSSDFRTQTGIGVLLARYRLYDEAIQHFRAAAKADPDSDDVKFDLVDAYFRKGLYKDALDAAGQVSAQEQHDDAYLALLGDIHAHLGDNARASDIFRDAIKRNPDNDQYYLSLTLLQLRANDVAGADKTLQQGLARIPGSGKILWGLGIVSVLKGDTRLAADRLERAVDLLPEWPGSYSTLGVFYYQTGQISKAREALNRFKGSNAEGLDVSKIEEALSQAPETSSSVPEPMSMAARQQFLQFTLAVADRTL
jgi:tetratricopeptide (TPR) repeat protein